MKISTVVFAVLFFSLSVVPCTDEDAKPEYELLIDNQPESQHADLCSPFCFCQCCEMHSEYVVAFTVCFNPNQEQKIQLPMDLGVSGFSTSWWQPPKV